MVISAKVEHEFSLTVEDDGVGPENNSAVAGGALSIESEPGRFTRVTLSMPLAETHPGGARE